MTETVIEIEHAVKRFRAGDRAVTALDDLSARIGGGRLTGLIGPDGAGKTTLMRLISGLLRPDGGTIRVLGMDSAARAQDIQANIGYMPQRFGLYEDLAVIENLSLYADLQGLVGPARRERFDRLMDFTGLGPFRHRLAGRLSGGMKQKLGLACTLVRSPRLLLLDEPSVGVDPVSRRELWDIVHGLVDDGITVLWATAYLDEAERCDDILLLNQGRLLTAGPPGRFREAFDGLIYALRPDPGTKRYLLRQIAALPQVTDAVVKGSDIRAQVAPGAPKDYLDLQCLALGAGPVSIRRVEPTFEDAFIAVLKDRAAVDAPDDGFVPKSQTAPDAEAARPRDEDVIRVAGLVRRFGAFTAVDGIDFTVNRGEIFGLLGPNGAGKSTTFRMLCGLLPPSGGTAQVLGIDLGRAAAVARGRIGYMAQKFSLYGNMSVRQNLRFFASAYGLAGRDRDERIDREVAEFGLTPYLDDPSADLPLGFKQRLALACAIMHEPGVLFLDEPTSGVDPLVRREFWTRINAMADAGVTVLVTTHFMEEAEYCDRIGVIYRGRLIALGTPDNLKAERATPQHPSPSLEDTFIALIETSDRDKAA